ncbi:hypothetical protein KCU77_g11086, partial [Aureobasidium melanogenum]
MQCQKRGRHDELESESEASNSLTKRAKTAKRNQDDVPGSATLSLTAPANKNWPCIRYDDGLMTKNQKRFLLAIMRRMKLTKSGRLFLRDQEPLSVLLNDPEYQTVIKRHVDLDTIEKGISNGDYLAVDYVVDEFELMFTNAFLYWGVGHENFDDAMLLRQRFFEKMKSCPRPLSDESESNNALEDAEREPISCRWDNRRTFVVCGLSRQTLETYEAEDRARGFVKPQSHDRRIRRGRHKKEKTALKGISTSSEGLDEIDSREQSDNAQDEPDKHDGDEATRLENIIATAKILLAKEKRKGKKPSDGDSEDVVVEADDPDEESQTLEQEIEELQAKLADKSEKKKLLAEIENLDTEDARLNSKIIEMEKQCVLLSSKVEDCRKELDALNDQLAKPKLVRERLKKEEARIHQEQQRLQQEVKRIEREKERYLQESEKTKSDIALHNERGTKLTQEHEKLQEDHLRVFEDREYLKQSREQLEMQRRAAKKRIGELNKSNK